MRKVKAIAKTERAPGAEMIDVEVPKIKPDEVLVKVEAASICGTDVHIYEWDKWAQGRIKNIPQILGHEFAGIVYEVGNKVKKIQKGDYVSAETHIYCDECIQCFEGQKHICGNLKILGVDCNGCFAEFIAVPEKVVWKNSRNIPFWVAPIQEPLGNAVYCALGEKDSTPLLGRTVLIFGDGPTGLFACGVAAVEGAAKIFHVGRHPFRLDIAWKMGADVLINDHQENVEGIVMEATRGIGVDVVLEMAGSQKAIQQGLNLVRKGGRFSAFGIASEAIPIEYSNNIVFKGVTINGINGRLIWNTWRKVSSLLSSGRLDVSPVITHRLLFEEFEEGFSLVMTRPKVSGKVVLLL